MKWPLLGLGGLLILAALFVPASHYRDTRHDRCVQAERRLATFQGLAAICTQHKTNAITTQQSLFALFNSRAGEIGVSGSVEKLRPQTDRSGAERLEARLSGVYQDQGLKLLWALEQEQGVRIESLILSRTAQGLLDMDLVLAAGTS